MRNLFPMATCFATLGLVLASCAPAVAPTPVLKATTPPSKAETPAAKPATTPAPSLTPKPAVDQPQYGGLLTLIQETDPASLDIHQDQAIASRTFTLPAYDTLLQYHPLNQTEIVPDLAKRWEVSQDGATWAFYLQEGVKFHDGSLLTAEDVLHSLERLRNPPRGIRSPRKDLLEAVDRIEAPNASSVKVTLKYPDNSFMVAVVLGAHVIYPKRVVEEKGDMKRTVLGTGPFKFVKHDAGVGGEFVKNKDYFVSGRPYLDGINIWIIKDSATRLAAFRTKKALISAMGAGALRPAHAESVRKEMGDKVVLDMYNSIGLAWLDMNVSKPPWSDIRVRQATHMAIDRQRLLEIVEEGVGKVGTFMMPGGIWIRPEAELRQLPGFRSPKDADRAEAKRLLTEAGYPQGFKTRILARAAGVYEAAAEVIKDQLATVGIDVALDVVETGVRADRKFREAYELHFDSLGVPVDDPTEHLSMFLRPGISFKDAQVDELNLQQRRILDPSKRKEAVRKLEDRLLEQLPASPLYWIFRWLARWNEVRNFPTPIGMWIPHKYTEVWLAR